jgi:hypothetical protein
MKRWTPPALNALCALLGFILVCAVLGKMFPREVTGISAKVRNFRAQRNKIDVLFVGSSRVFHGISPKVFDRALREEGRPWRSFNAGMDGMNPAEELALIRRLLAFHPRKLKYIFFEFQSDPAAGTPVRDSDVRERDVYWRDWPALLAGLRKFAIGLSSPLPSSLGGRFSLGRLAYFGPLLSADVRLWFRNFAHVGEGFEIFDHLLGRGSAARDPVVGLKDGFFPMDTRMSPEILSKYRASFAEMDKYRRERLPEPVMQDQLKRFAREMARRHITVVFLLPPAVIGNLGDEVNAPPGSLLLAYDDEHRYPDFYAEENRQDRQHLNGRGARLFSRRLALDFVAALERADR